MSPLESLRSYLDSLEGPAELSELMDRLRQYRIEADDVREFIRFSSRQYARNLVCSGEWYHMLVLCWQNGQRSPIHDHRGSACAVRVLHGTMTETRFDFSPNGLVRPVSSQDYPPGSVVGSLDGDTHQVSNLQAGDEELVTLHIYSPPLLYMGTYSLTDSGRGTEPMFVEFCDAAGI